MTTRVCVPIMEANVEDANRAIRSAKEGGADIVELRLDYIPDLDDGKVGDLVDSVEIPKIITIRPEREGGFWRGEEKDRVDLFLTALSFGAEYVDVEVSTDVGWRYEISKACKSSGSKMIISYHNFEKTPPKEELIDICKNEYAAGALIAKIATTVASIDDVSNILSVVDYFRRKEREIIGIGMGRLGRITRIMGPLLGSYLTYASLEKGKESAEGQLTLEETKTVLQILQG